MAKKTSSEQQTHMPVIDVESSRTQALAKQVPEWVQKAAVYASVTTVAQQAAGQQLILELKSTIKEAKTWFKGLKAPLDAAKAAVLRKEHEIIDPLERALDVVGESVAAFDRKQREEAARKQRALEAQERARAEAERALEVAALAKQIAAAKGASKQELKQELVDLEEAPIEVQVATIVPKVATTSGLQTRQNWHAVVTDLRDLQIAVCCGEISWDVFVVNQPFLNQVARETKVEGTIFPGVQCVAEQSYVTR